MSLDSLLNAVKQRTHFPPVLWLLGMTLLPNFSIYAQTPGPIITLSTENPGGQEWSLDGRYLAWAEIGPNPSATLYVDYSNWKLYDVQTGQVSSSDGYPFLPHLSARESQVLAPEPPGGKVDDKHPKVVYVSPNGRYLVFAGKRQAFRDGFVWKLMLGDRQKLQLLE